MPTQNSTATPTIQLPSGLATLLDRNLIRLMGRGGVTPRSMGRQTRGAARERALAGLMFNES